MNRRQLLAGVSGLMAGAALGKFPIPEHEKPCAGKCTLWLVLCGGHCQGADGLGALDAIEKKAVALGYEPLDRRHEVGEMSELLVRKSMAPSEALSIEREIIGGDGIGLEASALWIEAPR